MRPVHPARQGLAGHDFRNRLAVIAFHARGHFIVIGAEELREMGGQRVTAQFFKLGQEIRRPVGPVLIGVMILRPRPGAFVMGKGVRIALQPAPDGVRINQVQHPALTAGRGPLHLLAGGLLGKRIQPRVLIPGSPVHAAIRTDFIGQIPVGAIGQIGDERLGAGGVKVVGQGLTGGNGDDFHHHGGIGIAIADIGSAEAPAGAGGHVHAQVQAVGLGDRVAQHPEPAGA